jgi:S-formylglutathione hydrolase FrmB
MSLIKPPKYFSKFLHQSFLDVSVKQIILAFYKYEQMKSAISLLLFFFAFVFSKAATVDTVLIYSKSMHKNVKCIVIKPNEYNNNSKRFPALYLLHGYSGNYSDWVLKAPDLLQNVDETKFLVICPDGAYNSWYFDSPLDTTMKYETNVALEIPAYIDEHYRTIANRKARAIAGLSMGGHGAFYLAIRHQNVFGAVGSMSGGVDIRPFPDNWDIKKYLGDYTTHPDNWNNNTVINVIDTLKNGTLSITFDCGVGDFFLQVNRNLHQKLLDKKIDHDYTERPGEHNWEYWNNAVKYQLLFFRQYFIKNKVLSE